MSFSISVGTSVDDMQRAMGKPSELPQLQQQTDLRAVPKRARVRGRFKADDPVTTSQDEAWERKPEETAEPS